MQAQRGGARRHGVFCSGATRPADAHSGRGLRQQQGGGILRPVTRARGNDLGRPGPGGRDRPEHAADALWIVPGSRELHPQGGSGAAVVEKAGAIPRLGHQQIRPAVCIKVGHGAATLLTVNGEAADRRSDRLQPSGTVPAQEQAAPGVIARSLRLGGKEVLRQEDILAAVPIEVRNDHAKGRRQLRLHRQRDRLEFRPQV